MVNLDTSQPARFIIFVLIAWASKRTGLDQLVLLGQAGMGPLGSGSWAWTCMDRTHIIWVTPWKLRNTTPLWVPKASITLMNMLIGLLCRRVAPGFSPFNSHQVAYIA